jgi:hypothetical protein
MATFFQKFKSYTGPKRHVFIDPDTGYQFEEKDHGELVRRIVKYREQNNLPQLEALKAVIENFQCLRPENAGSCEESPILDRGFIPSIKGGVALLKSMFFEAFVTQEKAEKRASICMQCPYNVFPNKTHFTAWADKVAVWQVGERKTSKHTELGNCGICSCPLRSKVFYGGKIKLERNEYMKMPEQCWQKKEVDGKDY